ncbi:MAG: CBS domain-containing protein [Chloroflexi bacterium]|nr:CBS domain-containing protein [Chloroflexota bacterium]
MEVKSLGNTTERLSRAELKTEKIKAVSRSEPLTARMGTSLGAAIEQMRAGEGECLLICDGKRLVGMLTESDVLLKVLGRDIDLNKPVDELMTREPEVISPDATVLEGLETMDRVGYRSLPLIDARGELAGVLRQQDVLEYVSEAFPQEILNLPPRPHQLMEQPEGA